MQYPYAAKRHVGKGGVSQKHGYFLANTILARMAMASGVRP